MIYSFSPFGYEGQLITIEVDLRRGIPAVDIVGLADSCIKESRERVIAAIKNNGFDFPSERVLISLSPADLKKESEFDLPIALEILKTQSILYDSLDEDVVEKMSKTHVLVMGKLDVSGKILPVKGIHGACSTALAYGIEYAILPKGTDVPVGIKVCEVENLGEAFYALLNIGNNCYFKTKDEKIKSDFSTKSNPVFDDSDFSTKFDELKLNGLKYAMTVAAAGRHNLLAFGSPGCGKTLALQMMPLLTPRLTFEQTQSVTRIWSLAGLMKPDESYIKTRAFRMPHQTASIEGICGGGVNVRPGEISLAHNGTLFLDEASEFRCSVLQMLRVPLESKTITLVRSGRSTVYPANFQLIMAASPCPCGNYGSSERICLCSMTSIKQYWKKFGDPLLDRVEIRYDCNADKVFNRKLNLNELNLNEARELITRAWKRQMKRQGKMNSELDSAEIIKICQLSEQACKRLEYYELTRGYSSRTVANILKVARTLHDMFDEEESDVITDIDIAVALHGKLPLEV